MLRWKPNMDAICESLLGTSIATWKGKEQKITGVRYPTMERRLLIYREGLELVFVFKDRIDLFTLAVYRRQVTIHGDCPLDGLFLRAAEMFDLSSQEWGDIARRMPKHSKIKSICARRARPVQVQKVELPIAA